MFSVLHQGSSVYILDKSSPLTLKIGTVTGVTSPVTYSPYVQNSNIDIVVKVDGETLEFKQLPSSQSLATYSNTVISESKDLMVNEVESLIRNSKQVIDSIPEHESIISSGEEILTQLSPQFAQQKDQELKIGKLETKVGGMESKLDDIYTLLTKISNK